MGLSERKTKQRLGADPRNLAWANGKSAMFSCHHPRRPIRARKFKLTRNSLDNSRFGQQYLEKFGWTAGSGSGLGASGQGRLSHISVTQKLDLLGICSNNNRGDVSWKQNQDYELMLKRLNTSGGDEVESIKVSIVPDGFVRAVGGDVMDEKVETNVPVEEVDEKERKRLRKERKRKEKAAAKAKASITHDETSSEAIPPSATMNAAPTISSSQPVAPTKPPRRMA